MHPGDWNGREHTQLWLYNLHYFDWLREQAAPQRTVEDGAWLDRWIGDNPSGRGVGWEPYPLSIRIVNWIVWFLTIGQSERARLDSLAEQVRHLSGSIEYHLLGNHLLANAKALAFAGTFFAGPEAEGWRAQGLALLARELREQILADGAHFELSPMYHALVLEDILDLLGLVQAYPDVLAQPCGSLRLAEIAARMAAWLKQMLHPDGQIAYFNDAAVGIAPSPEQLFAYAAARGIVAPEFVAAPIASRPSGYAVLAAPPFHLIFDCGRIGPDYLPGHAHADTLSFELSLGRQRLITNSGTSTYAPGADRQWERSTRAHATVEIDGIDSAEAWASFRVGRRPNLGPITSGRDAGGAWVECWHDGYRHLAGRPVHHRRVQASPHGVEITDRIEGSGNHAAAGFFPVHPGIGIAQTGDHAYRLTMSHDQEVDVLIDGPVDTCIGPGRFAPEFGVRVQRPVIEWRWQGPFPLRVQTRFRLAAR